MCLFNSLSNYLLLFPLFSQDTDVDAYAKSALSIVRLAFDDFYDGHRLDEAFNKDLANKLAYDKGPLQPKEADIVHHLSPLLDSSIKWTRQPPRNDQVQDGGTALTLSLIRS